MDLMINLNTRHQIMNYFRCFFLPCECLIKVLNYRLGQFSILSLDPIIKSNRLWAPHFVMQQFSTLKARLCIGAKHARLLKIHNGSSDKKPVQIQPKLRVGHWHRHQCKTCKILFIITKLY